MFSFSFSFVNLGSAVSFVHLVSYESLASIIFGYRLGFVSRRDPAVDLHSPTAQPVPSHPGQVHSPCKGSSSRVGSLLSSGAWGSIKFSFTVPLAHCRERSRNYDGSKRFPS